jgi:polyisoprenoid-binding protein YceI
VTADLAPVRDCLPAMSVPRLLARGRNWAAIAASTAATLALSLTFFLSLAAPSHAADFDPKHTRIGFTLKTRWGQVLQGRFPNYTGQIESLPDGRYRARLRLDARTVEMVNHPKYTGLTRGDGFFEADRFPEVEFISEPYPASLLRAGGKLAGELRIRDVRRREIFTIEPSECARPARDCDLVASGTVRRSDYGVDRWMFAVSDAVRFQLRLRQADGAEAATP